MRAADETPKDVANGPLNTSKSCSFELCLLAVENLFEILNGALHELRSENLKLSLALESISSNSFSRREIQSDRRQRAIGGPAPRLTGLPQTQALESSSN